MIRDLTRDLCMTRFPVLVTNVNPSLLTSSGPREKNKKIKKIITFCFLICLIFFMHSSLFYSLQWTSQPHGHSKTSQSHFEHPHEIEYTTLSPMSFLVATRSASYYEDDFFCFLLQQYVSVVFHDNLFVVFHDNPSDVFCDNLL